MKKLYSTTSRWSSIADAKARLNIYDLWKHFGFEGEAGANCCSPFRDDNHPSFSVNEDGTLWHDFGTGEGGDSVDFFQRATGLTKKDACRKFIQLASGRIIPWTQSARQPLRDQPTEVKPKPAFPRFRKGTGAEIQQLASLRHISCDGLELAMERGLLWFGQLNRSAAWVVTDAAQLNAQARRMDGQRWEHIGAKAWTLPGSWASWPIGITEAQPFPNIALCEGGPDLLAGCDIIFNEFMEAHCSPVAMLGATQRIHSDALPLFAGKRVRIFGHDDEAGRAAVERWARQLVSTGAEVDAVNFAGLVRTDGQPVKDLNDSLLMDADSFASLERMLP